MSVWVARSSEVRDPSHDANSISFDGFERAPDRLGCPIGVVNVDDVGLSKEWNNVLVVIFLPQLPVEVCGVSYCSFV